MYALTTLTTWHKYLSMDGRTDGMADGKVISQTNAHYRERETQTATRKIKFKTATLR